MDFEEEIENAIEKAVNTSNKVNISNLAVAEPKKVTQFRTVKPAKVIKIDDVHKKYISKDGKIDFGELLDYELRKKALRDRNKRKLKIAKKLRKKREYIAKKEKKLEFKKLKAETEKKMLIERELERKRKEEERLQKLEELKRIRHEEQRRLEKEKREKEAKRLEDQKEYRRLKEEEQARKDKEKEAKKVIRRDKKDQKRYTKARAKFVKEELKRRKIQAHLDERYTPPKKKRNIFNRIANNLRFSDEYNLEYQIVKDDYEKGEVDLDGDWDLIQAYEDVKDDKLVRGGMTAFRLGLCALGVAGIIAGAKFTKLAIDDAKTTMQDIQTKSEMARNDLWRSANLPHMEKRAESAVLTLGDAELVLEWYCHDNQIEMDSTGRIIDSRPIVITEDQLEEYWSNIPDNIRKWLREPSRVIDCTGKYFRSERDDFTFVYNEREITENDEREVIDDGEEKY